MSDIMHLADSPSFERFRHAYRAAIKEVRTKIEILSEDFAVRHDYNPIHHMERRLKSPESIEEKLIRYGKEISIESARENIMDIAGIRVVCNFIDDVYAIADMLMEQNDISLIDLSKRISYDYTYLSKFFQEKTGMPFNTYVNHLRINEACFLLSETSQSILEIALLCGYNSVRSFNRNFRKLRGSTPTDYRMNLNKIKR